MEVESTRIDHEVLVSIYDGLFSARAMCGWFGEAIYGWAHFHTRANKFGTANDVMWLHSCYQQSSSTSTVPRFPSPKNTTCTCNLNYVYRWKMARPVQVLPFWLDGFYCFFVLGYSVDIPVFSRHHQMVVPIGFIGVSDRAGNVTAPHVVGV